MESSQSLVLCDKVGVPEESPGEATGEGAGSVAIEALGLKGIIEKS